MARLRQTAAPASTLPLRGPRSSRGRRRLLIFLVVFGLALSLFPAGPAPAWGAGLLDPSFNPGLGAQMIPIIRGKVDYPDGRALIFGQFGWYNGTAGRYYYSLARLNADGSLDTSFIPAISPIGDIRCAALLSSGQILIGGSFSTSSSPYYYNLARLNSDGAVDATFSRIIMNPGPVNALGVQSDDKILVGGWGIVVSGDNTHAYHLLRLQSDGSLDTAYPKRSSAGYVHSIEILNDPFELPDRARILGSLPNASNFNNDYLLTLDSYGFTEWSLGDDQVNGPILAMVKQADGSFVIGGQFSQVLGATRNGVARLSRFLTLDPFFNQGGSGAGGGPVTSLLLQGNKIVAGGHFTSFNGAACGFLVRLNADGKPDGTFTPGSGANDPLFSITAAGGGLVICGAFRSYNGVTRNGIASLSADGVLGSQYTSFSFSGFYFRTVYALAVQADGKVLVGGDFTGMDGKYHHGLARLNANGSVDASFRAGVDGWVKNIALQPDGKILLAGWFGQANSYSRTSLARLNPDGSLDLTFNPVIQSPAGMISQLWQVVRLSTGQIMIAGNLNSVNGLPRIGVARLDSFGGYPDSFNPQITLSGGGVNWLYTVAESASGYVVGGRGTVQGQNRGFLARLTDTGSMDATFGPTGGSTPSPNAVISNGEIFYLFLQTDNRIVVGGSFTQIIDGSPSPPPRNYLARFTADGGLDGTFTTNPGANGPVYWMAPQTGGRILIGGNCSTYDAAARQSIARVNGDGSLDTSFDPGAGVAGAVAIILPTANGCALIGGHFGAYDNTARGSLARILVGSPPTAASLLLLSD